MISLYSYVLIITWYWTSICYDSGVKLDDSLSKSTNSMSILVRWGIFLGGIFISFILGFFLLRVANDYLIFTGTMLPPAEYDFLFKQLPIVMFWVIIALSILAGLLLLIGHLNAWLGIFFPLSAIYTFFLIMQAILRTDTAPPTPIPGFKYLIMGLDIFLLLFTTATLLGKKAETMDEKVKIISQDSIILWFFFAKASFEYADVALEGVFSISILKTVGVFFVFVPLLVLSALYGMIMYGKLKKRRKRVKKRKATMKKRK